MPVLRSVISTFLTWLFSGSSSAEGFWDFPAPYDDAGAEESFEALAA